jgi:succinyl-CoA synthetase alpha subunit
MLTGYVIRKNEYHDSVFLMRAAKQISEQEGILEAAAFMGTERNKALLADIGFGEGEVSAATPNDLIIAVKAENTQILTTVLENIESWLHSEQDISETSAMRTLEEAVAREPNANLAVISVPGAYAAREAKRALEKGLHVFLFSDNVSLEKERSLKAYAREHGLLVMGPDCGTAIIGGAGIGFANAVRRGPIGVIGTSGTGIQEFTSLVHQYGSGISHAIGTGSRDLSDAIGGLSTVSALNALESDPTTEVIGILAKPPDPMSLDILASKILKCQKPVVTCFLGLKKDNNETYAHLGRTHTLDEAAALAVQMATGNSPSPVRTGMPEFQELIHREVYSMKPKQKYIRGLFAGGTFCYQAQQVLRDAGITVHSNAPIEGNQTLSNPLQSTEHTMVDMGADEFTAGRPHPMIDCRARYERILAEAEDSQVAILLLDFILGHNSSPNPAGELAAAIAEAKSAVKKRGGFLSVVASVCGTEEDPQGLQQQTKLLEEAGVVVFQCSAHAALFCVRMLASL